MYRMYRIMSRHTGFWQMRAKPVSVGFERERKCSKP